jgi:hypothetical protein
MFLNNYRPFISTGAGGASLITVHPLPALRRRKLAVTVTDEGWKVHRSDFASASSPAFTRTDLLIDRNKYSMDSWLRVYCSLRGLSRDALLIHGAGYVLPDRGFIFPGRSGRGKSTLIRILGRERALSDEVTIAYRRHSAFRCASTPFWGELKRGADEVIDTPLRALCFLAHGETNFLEKLSPGTALRELLKTVLFFSDDPRSHEKLLAIAAGIVSATPSYRLVFSKHAKRPAIVHLLSSL